MKFFGEIEVSGNGKTWLYDVLRCIANESRISFDFQGAREGCHFTGHCIAEASSSAQFIGVGKFQYRGYEAYESPIQLQLKSEGDFLILQGAWQEDGVNYQMQGELEACLR